MGKSKKSFWSIVDKALGGWSILLMAVMATMVVLSVLLRYVFNITYTWSEELIIYLFVATTYFGSIMCVREKEHIDIPFLRQIVSKNIGTVMDIVVCLVNIAVQIGLAYFSITWIEKTGSSLSSGMYIPLYIIYSMFPICFILMAMYTFRRIENDIIPKIMAETKSDAVKAVLNAVFFVIYAAALAIIAYLYFGVGWIEKIKTSYHSGMMTEICVVFTIMFALCSALVAAFAVKRVISIFKKEELTGGEQ